VDVTQQDVINAYRTFYARPHEVIDIALMSEDLEAFAAALVAQLDVSEAEAEVLVTIPVQRLTRKVRLRMGAG
jgi:hypothetical protein